MASEKLCTHTSQLIRIMLIYLEMGGGAGMFRPLRLPLDATGDSRTGGSCEVLVGDSESGSQKKLFKIYFPFIIFFLDTLFW